jgi:pimeloyl-ACP methyl ester carboxylesterase
VLFVLAMLLAMTPLRAQGQPQPSLFMECLGEPTDAPTVVLEAGAFGTSADWDRVEQAIAPGGRVCAYDRGGLGRSAQAPETPDALGAARALAERLDQLGETAPVILAGHSNGGLYVEAFAALFPQRTAGLLLVDAVGSDDLDNPRVLAELRGEETEADLAVAAGELGLSGLFVPQMVAGIGLRGPAAEHKREALLSSRHLRASRKEVLQVLPSLAAVRALGPLNPDIPVVVIVASQHPGQTRDEAWRTVQVAPARRACRGWVLDATGATHVSPLGRDRAYVSAAVSWLRDEARRGPSTVCTPDAYRR